MENRMFLSLASHGLEQISYIFFPENNPGIIVTGDQNNN